MKNKKVTKYLIASVIVLGIADVIIRIAPDQLFLVAVFAVVGFYLAVIGIIDLII